MSSTAVNTATATVQGDADAVARLLLGAEIFPTWNPAFTHVGPRKADGTHTVTVLNTMKGTLACSRPDLRTINFHIAIPGLTEESTFILSPGPRGTQITHSVAQHGFLTGIIGKKEASLVPSKRLTRLAHTLSTSD